MIQFLRKLLPVSSKKIFRKKLNLRRISISQAGQDFWVYGEAFNEKENGYFVDIGAFDGLHISNSYLLETDYNWSGICIEANPKQFHDLKKNRNVTCLNVCLDQQEGEVEFIQRHVMSGIIDDDLDNTASDDLKGEVISIHTTTLRKVLKENNAPKVIDYLSIDVEGAEERILSEFDFNEYKFRSITIERPSDKLRSIFEDNDYCLIKEIPGLDCFYIHRDFLDQYHSNLFQFYHKKYLRLPRSR
ncbi:MAG: FkbM family methyltransferase [Balneolaceae bacterium]|nr:FkbM family methyltransferase [Balneolaceae bacterium]MDR9410140.1 FkbM family methyltransferase [Balneolaceae bacterium]